MRAAHKIISGGQTGADRAALDAARALGVACGGWVPRGRWAQDGAIDAAYSSLCETMTADPAERTRLNVVDSDATLIVSHGALHGGAALTLQIARELAKPVLHIDLTVTAKALAVETSASGCERTRSRRSTWLVRAPPRTR